LRRSEKFKEGCQLWDVSGENSQFVGKGRREANENLKKKKCKHIVTANGQGGKRKGIEYQKKDRRVTKGRLH